MKEKALEIFGPFDPYEAVKSLIMNESAFSFVAGLNEVRVAFYKGEWDVRKFTAGGEDDRIVLSDAHSLSVAENELTRGLFGAMDEIHGGHRDGDIICRTAPARVLTEFFRVWAGRGDSVTRIHVRQAGRNATFDKDGNFVLCP